MKDRRTTEGETNSNQSRCLPGRHGGVQGDDPLGARAGKAARGAQAVLQLLNFAHAW